MKRLELLEVGQDVGRYRVLDVLGQGGMAVVYRVRHLALQSIHALKVTAVPSRSILRRLMREGSAQARVRHRNIVAVNDVIEVEGCPGLIMEYVAGPALDELLHEQELTLEQVDRLARGLLRGLGAAHSAGLVHRDLKPANVLVSVEEDGWIPKIADFGLVKDVAIASETRSGAFMGTPNYMSPEQIRDARSVDGRSDLFAVGCILYEMVCGRQAFQGEDLLDIFNRIANGDYQPLVEVRPDTPPRMLQAVEAALQVNVDDRPENTDALLELWCGDVSDAALTPDAATLARELALPTRPVPGDVGPTLAAVTFHTEDLGKDDLPSVPPKRGGRAPVRGTIVTPEPVSRHSMPDTTLPPERRNRAPLLAGVAGMGLLALGAVGVLGAGGLGWWWWSLEQTVAVAPEPAPLVEPEPVPEPAPHVEPEPAPEPEPELPAPVAPAPVAVAPAPVAAPAPVVPIEPEPEPEPEPAAKPQMSSGYVVVKGDVDKVLLFPAEGGLSLPPGPVPPGTYLLAGTIDGESVTFETIEVGTERLVYQCSRMLKRCVSK